MSKSTFSNLPQGLIDAVTKILEDDAKELCPGCGELKSACICEMTGSYGAPSSGEGMAEDEDKDAPESEGEKVRDDKDLEEDDIPGQDDSKFDAQRDEKEKESKKDLEEDDSPRAQWERAAALNENVAVDSDDLASTEPRSALGQRDSEYPKHVDIVKETDFRPVGAEGSKSEGFRLLVQYSTNTRSEYVPSLDLPAAPTLEALSAMVPGDLEVSEAIRNALHLPCEQPNFKGQAPYNEEVKKSKK